MSTTEFPAPGLGAGINSQIEINRSQPVVLRNSRFLVGVTMTGSLFAAVFAVCMVLMVISMLFPLSDLTTDREWSVFRWAISTLALAICVRACGAWLATRQVTKSGSIAGE